ncbi:MAG: ABC transporter substrate-binding protein, partial [Actinomycetia bacterium]|nr:ABC transporter substrate-binding protein [Actinomycetes bacterium]
MRHERRLRRWLSLFAVLALVLAACSSGGTDEADSATTTAAGQDSATTTAAPQFAGTIILGAAVSETGKFAREGKDTRQGYETWLDWVNNEYGGINVGGDRYKVEIVFYDDEGDADTTANLIEKLITEDDANFLLGPYSSGLTAGASAVAEQYDMIMIEGNGA